MMKSLLVLLLLSTVPAFAQTSPNEVGSFETKIRIEKTWVRWEGTRAFIEKETLCETSLPLKLYDVRNLPHLRGKIEEIRFPCKSQVDGENVLVSVGGKAEWLRPRDFIGWIDGERDLFRVAFSLLVQGSPESGSGVALQEVSGVEIMSEDLDQKSLIFRLAPDELIGLTCSRDACRNEGLPAIFRAFVEMKKSLPKP